MLIAITENGGRYSSHRRGRRYPAIHRRRVKGRSKGCTDIPTGQINTSRVESRLNVLRGLATNIEGHKGI